jgi:hypothetical protein
MDWRMVNRREFRKNRVMPRIDVTERHDAQLVVQTEKQLYKVSAFGNERVYQRLWRRVGTQIRGELPRVLACGGHERGDSTPATAAMLMSLRRPKAVAKRATRPDRFTSEGQARLTTTEVSAHTVRAPPAVPHAGLKTIDLSRNLWIDQASAIPQYR